MLSLVVINVERISIDLTTPRVSLSSSMKSPTFSDRSNSRISPDTKLLKMACMPKPSPTPMAPVNTANWLSGNPATCRAISTPATRMA